MDAPRLSVEGILDRAACYKADGADVIDLGCLPGVPFPHLEEAIAALHERGYRVSVDSLVTEELLRGGRNGAAREDRSLPRGYDASLCALHERKPFPYSESEIAEIAAESRDPSYRVNVSAAGIHVYNRDGMTTATDPFDLYPRLDLLQGDAPHAFYMGVKLGRAQIAPGSSASVMYRTSPSNGAVRCVPLRPRTPRARTPTNPMARL